MLNILKTRFQNVANSFGYKISKINHTDPVMDKDMRFRKIFEEYSEYTYTSKEKMFALYKAVQYVIDAKIPGDFVECGVWRGGSTMLIAKTLLELGVTDRKIYLYDTFEGMSSPTENDFDILDESNKASNRWSGEQKENYNNWCYASLEEVKKNMAMTGYPGSNIIYVKGMVEKTIPKTTPSQISILRLDTDFYESSKHELVHLFPLLSKNGVLLLDDYGAWAGQKKSTDEYFADKPILLNRIDVGGRIGIKIQ